jgi:hypothetical protein
MQQHEAPSLRGRCEDTGPVWEQGPAGPCRIKGSGEEDGILNFINYTRSSGKN